jgi:hypothetical protein
MSVRPAAFAGAATSKTLTAGGQKLTELRLSSETQKLAKALDDNKDTGDAGDVRAYKADPKQLAKLSSSQLEKVVKLAVATPGYVDDKGNLPSDQRFNISKVKAGDAFKVLRDAFENTDDKTKTPERTALEGTIRSTLSPLLAGKGVEIFQLNMPDDGYGALAGLAVVEKSKGEIRIVDNTVIP